MQESLSVAGQEAVVDSQSPSLSAAAAAAAVKGPEMVDRRCHGMEKHLGRHGYELPGAFSAPFYLCTLLCTRRTQMAFLRCGSACV